MGDETFDYPTMARALILGDKDTVARKTREGLDLSLDPKALIFKGLIPGMDVVGEKFRRNEYYVPQVLLSARAMYAGLDLLKPLITKAGGPEQSLGVVVIGHGAGRPPRHRQEPGGDDAGGRRLQGGEPGARRGTREVRRRRAGARRADRRHLRAHDDDHARDEAHDRCPGKGRGARPRQGHDRRGPGEPGVRGGDRRRRLREGLDDGGGAGQGVARRAGESLMATRPRGLEIIERVRAGEILVFDGAYGTALFEAGLSDGHCPELWNDTRPDVVRGIHKAYFEAGSDVVETNTFGASRLKLKEYNERYGYAVTDRTRELNEKGARLARSVCPPGGWIAGSIGPTSAGPADYGVGDNIATDEEYFETFKEQAEALADGGVDIFAVETMMFPQEAIAAIRACKAMTDLPVT